MRTVIATILLFFILIAGAYAFNRGYGGDSFGAKEFGEDPYGSGGSAISEGDALLLENGDYLLLENGDKLLLE